MIYENNWDCYDANEKVNNTLEIKLDNIFTTLESTVKPL